MNAVVKVVDFALRFSYLFLILILKQQADNINSNINTVNPSLRKF